MVVVLVKRMGVSYSHNLVDFCIRMNRQPQHRIRNRPLASIYCVEIMMLLEVVADTVLFSFSNFNGK